MSHTDNDDDLFDYDPEQDITSSEPTTYSSSSQSSQKSVNDFISDTKSLIEDIVLSDNDEVVDQKKVKLSLGFHGATHAYFSRQEHPAFLKSIFMVLDKLTNGEFTLLHILNSKEALILQRMKFISLVQAMISPSSDGTSALSDLMKIIKVDYDSDHINIFYATSLNISRHILTLDRAIYSQLCEKLNVPPKDFLFNDQYLDDPIAFAEQSNNFELPSYQDDAYAAIATMLANEGLLERLSQSFSTPVTLFDNVHDK